LEAFKKEKGMSNVRKKRVNLDMVLVLVILYCFSEVKSEVKELKE